MRKNCLRDIPILLPRHNLFICLFMIRSVFTLDIRSGSRIKVPGSCVRDATSRGVPLARVKFFAS